MLAGNSGPSGPEKQHEAPRAVRRKEAQAETGALAVVVGSSQPVEVPPHRRPQAWTILPLAETSGEARAGTLDGNLLERLPMQAMAVEEQPSPLRPFVR